MAIGVEFGTNEPSADRRKEAYDRARTLCRRFEREHGSILCRDLIGYDLSNLDELEEARRANVFGEKCDRYVRSVIEMLLKSHDR